MSIVDFDFTSFGPHRDIIISEEGHATVDVRVQGFDNDGTEPD